MAGILYLVATPIGNLDDMTARALGVLREVDLIACEDTRHTRVLLDHYGIKTKLVSYHEHNERERAMELADLLVEGQSIAVVSDAGTPGICDPAYRVVAEAITRSIRVVPIPGAAAFLQALVASGLPTDGFYFAGFLPSRGQARRQRLAEVAEMQSTLIWYESPHRIIQSLEDALAILGDRKAVVAREMTKLHEEFSRGRLSELVSKFSGAVQTRGELVVVVDREKPEVVNESGTRDLAALMRQFEDEGTDHRAALKRAAKELGISRDEAYRRLTEIRDRERRG